MHYDQISRTGTDYASIAHGMPEYRVLSYDEIDRGVAMAKHEQGRIFRDAIASGARWVSGLFSGGRTSAAS